MLARQVAIDQNQQSSPRDAKSTSTSSKFRPRMRYHSSFEKCSPISVPRLRRPPASFPEAEIYFDVCEWIKQTRVAFCKSRESSIFRSACLICLEKEDSKIRTLSRLASFRFCDSDYLSSATSNAYRTLSSSIGSVPLK
jgi:hypothetical protein